MADEACSEVANRAEEMRAFEEALKSDREDTDQRFDRMDRRLDRIEDELGRLDHMEDELRRIGDAIARLVRHAEEGPRYTRINFPRFDDIQSKGCINREEEVRNAQLQEEIIAVQICLVETFHQTPGEHMELQSIHKAIVVEIVTLDVFPSLRSKEQPITFPVDSYAAPQSLLANGQARSQECSANMKKKQSIKVVIVRVILCNRKFQGKASNTSGPKFQQLRSIEVDLDTHWLIAVGAVLWNFKKIKVDISLCEWKRVLRGDKGEILKRRKQ